MPTVPCPTVPCHCCDSTTPVFAMPDPDGYYALCETCISSWYECEPSPEDALRVELIDDTAEGRRALLRTICHALKYNHELLDALIDGECEAINKGEPGEGDRLEALRRSTAIELNARRADLERHVST